MTAARIRVASVAGEGHHRLRSGRQTCSEGRIAAAWVRVARHARERSERLWCRRERGVAAAKIAVACHAPERRKGLGEAHGVVGVAAARAGVARHAGEASHG